MTRPRVFIPGLFQETLNLLREKCELVVYNEFPPKRKEILELVRDVDAAVVYPKVTTDAEFLDAAGPRLKAVVTYSAGLDHVDIDEVKKRGIKLGNTQGVNVEAVADMAVLLALAAARRLKEAQRALEQGTGRPNIMFGLDFIDSTVGIVGLGGIGQGVVNRLKPFKVTKFLYTGPREKEEGKDLGAEYVSFNKLIENSDFIFITCPLNDDTLHLFNAKAFSKMRSRAILVNVARGEIVDQEALLDALKTGKIFAAGLDVTTPEPLPQDHELLRQPNCIVTPHVAFATETVRTKMCEIAAVNVLNALEGKEMLKPV